MADKLSVVTDNGTLSNVTNKQIETSLREATASALEAYEAQGRHRALMKRLKERGIDTDALKFTLKARRQDNDAVILGLRNTLRYLSVSGLPVSESGLFGGLNIAETPSGAPGLRAETAAEDAGYQSGKSNGAREDNPHPPGTAVHASWDEGFRRGLRAKATTDTPEVKTASTRKAKNRSGPAVH